MGTLGDLIETYESSHVEVPRASDLTMVRFLMDQHGLKQKDLSFAFGNEANTSATLAGKRPIGLAEAHRLGERFKVPVDLFLTRFGEEHAATSHPSV